MSRGPDLPVLAVNVTLRGKRAAALAAEAKNRRCTPADLIAAIVGNVADDELWRAVLEG